MVVTAVLEDVVTVALVDVALRVCVAESVAVLVADFVVGVRVCDADLVVVVLDVDASRVVDRGLNRAPKKSHSPPPGGLIPIRSTMEPSGIAASIKKKAPFSSDFPTAAMMR